MRWPLLSTKLMSEATRQLIAKVLLGLTVGITALINALLTWQWRFECYDRYLKQKYRLKNRTLRITG